MVLNGIEGYWQPDAVADPNASFWTGALFDWRRITGRVLKLPEWEVTAAHNAAATELGSTSGVLSAFQIDGPTVLGLIAGVFVFRWLVNQALSFAGNRLVPPASKENPDRKKTLNRFNNTGWEAIFYTMSAAFGLFVLHHESSEWSVWPTTNMWINWPLQPFGNNNHQLAMFLRPLSISLSISLSSLFSILYSLFSRSSLSLPLLALAYSNPVS